MFKIQSSSKIWKFFGISILIIVLSFTSINVDRKPAFSQSITGINAEISNLRSRINRLESEVRNLRQTNPAPGLPANNTPEESVSGEIKNPPVVNNQAIGRSDPLYERLATLLIELKEEVRDIERRLVIIEEKQ